MSQTLPQPLIDDLFSSLYRETFILYTLKHSLPYPVTLSHSDLLAIERSLISTKHPTKSLADSLLSLKDAQMLLSPVLRLWKQPQLVNIGSLKQQAFVTYLAYHLINRNYHHVKEVQPGEENYNALDDDDEIGAWVREGIEVRIGKVQSEKVVYDMGLVVWKAYMIAQGIEDQEVLTQLDEFQVDQDSIFNLLTKDEDTNTTIPPTSQKEERKLQPLAPVSDFYAQDDSDNDSDFDLKYAPQEDTFQDLIPIKRPLYLSDLIQGLQSDNHERFTLSIDTADTLIRNQKLNDLSVMADELLTLLFRLQNRFAVEGFGEKKYRAIQAVVEREPRVVGQVVARMLDGECSLGERMMLVEVLGKASQAMTNEKEEEVMGVKSYKEDLREENAFFSTQSLFDTPMVILGTLKRKLSPTKHTKGHLNHFHPHAEAFLTPFLHIFKSPLFLSQPTLLSKALFSLSLMLESAANHLLIEKFSQQPFAMWQGLAYSYTQNVEVVMNFAFVLSKLKRLTSAQVDQAIEWVDQQIEANGGNESMVEVGMLVIRYLRGVALLK
ncbi:hypothetical protein FGO68_gene9942 [Halteria grandinella]|uniref:Telomere length regulation protein conserved domain-containing protein n=1 Tax=Halteria grandinella TaxID=5974 RepID=A0A8J8NEJ9_HALGN|nr:hypothetical protein FGO68_gene9942 [Halteria grandinella]